MASSTSFQRKRKLPFKRELADDQTTIDELRKMVREFVDERDWQQSHAPKNISMALAVEAAELMEHFQWLTLDASREIRDDAATKQDVGEELADVVCYAMALANELDIDISTAMQNKMVKNRQKYPADKFKGRYE